MTKQDHDKECPRCVEITFQKGTLLVGGEPGGPLRFEFKQIEELGLVIVVNNVCAYCMAYIGKSDTCPHCGATRRTSRI